MKLEKLVEKHKVTEYKDGCIFKTESLGEEWVDINTELYKPNGNQEFYSTLSANRLKDLNYNNMRRV